MNCLFCKQISDDSKSVEHIIPESLGNKEHILGKGIVCDKCNNYFAVKIEQPLLQQNYFKSTRHRNDIENKKGNSIPDTGVIVHPDGGLVDVYRPLPGILGIRTTNERIKQLVENGIVNKLYIPISQEPEKQNILLSRFIGKVAIEALAKRLMPIDGWEQEVIFKKELDPLREYVRYNSKIKFWEYHQRRIYSETDRFEDTKENIGTFEILHEFTFHYSDDKELFFVMAIMGVEYAINLAGPEIESYAIELEKIKGKSFLEVEYEKKLTNNGNSVF